MSAPASTPTILIVDDEIVVLSALKETLEREKYHVTATTSAQKALALLAERDFGVIISDQRMPEMTGLEFLVESKKLRPLSSRILITAVLSLPTIVDAINKGEIFRFIAKPWLREELTATVKNAVNRYELIVQNSRLTSETNRLNAELTAANTQLAEKVIDLEARTKALDAANRELSENYDHSLDLCTRILTTYDPLLGGQTKSIVEIARQLAADSHFSPDEKRTLVTSAWLCDLGLIGISRELLHAFRRSPDMLSERDRNTLQSHPIYSQTLASYVDSSHAVAETIRAHHERYDGTGYPDNIARETIPWTARCLAVIVCFVESGLPKSQAIEKLMAESGTGLDPEAVRLFLKVTHLLQLPRQVHEILLDELQPGMTLANGLYSPHGLLLVGEGQTLSPAMIAKIQSHNRTDPIRQRLLVYS